STSKDRRKESAGSMSRSVRARAGSPSKRTCSRTGSGAAVGSARRSRTSSSNSRSKSTSVAGIVHQLLESFQRSAQASRAGGGADPEHAGGGRPVELQEDAEGDHLTLGCREEAERCLERTWPKGEILRLGKVVGVALLPPAASFLGAKVVEGGRPCDPAEPGSRGASARVESAPHTKSLLEGLS